MRAVRVQNSRVETLHYRGDFCFQFSTKFFLQSVSAGNNTVVLNHPETKLKLTESKSFKLDTGMWDLILKSK